MAIEVLDLGNGQLCIEEQDTCYVVVNDVGIQGETGPAGASGATGATGETGIIISETEPENTDVLWCDESEAGDAVVPVGGTTGQVLAKNSNSDYDTEWIDLANTKTTAITFTIDGAGSAITTGTKAYWRCPYACTIQKVTMLADVSTTTSVDIWVDTYANYPPTDLDTITASAVPTITAALKSEDATLTGWDTAIVAGDCIAFNVDANNNATKLTLILEVLKT